MCNLIKVIFNFIHALRVRFQDFFVSSLWRWTAGIMQSWLVWYRWIILLCKVQDCDNCCQWEVNCIQYNFIAGTTGFCRPLSGDFWDTLLHSTHCIVDIFMSFGHINKVTVRWAGLVLRWVTVRGYTVLVFILAKRPRLTRRVFPRFDPETC